MKINHAYQRQLIQDLARCYANAQDEGYPYSFPDFVRDHADMLDKLRTLAVTPDRHDREIKHLRNWWFHNAGKFTDLNPTPTELPGLTLIQGGRQTPKMAV